MPATLIRIESAVLCCVLDLTHLSLPVVPSRALATLPGSQWRAPCTSLQLRNLKHLRAAGRCAHCYWRRLSQASAPAAAPQPVSSHSHALQYVPKWWLSYALVLPLEGSSTPLLQLSGCQIHSTLFQAALNRELLHPTHRPREQALFTMDTTASNNTTVMGGICPKCSQSRVGGP